MKISLQYGKVRNPFDFKKIFLIMRLSILLLFVNLLQISATGFSQTGRFNLHLDKATIKEALTKIESQSSYKFVYRDSDIENKIVSTNIVNSSIDDVLKVMLANTGSRFRILDNNLIVIAPEEVLQQQKLTGTVVDETTGESLIGVSIMINGTTQGTVTDGNGKFNLTLPNSTATLKVSYMGYLPQIINIKGLARLDIKLAPDVKSLDEIIVVGYGVMKKSSLTGAISKINSKSLNTLPTSNTVEALQGKIAGVEIGSVTEPGADPQVLIRGTRSLNANNAPLYVVDGIPRSNGRTISDISVSEIESIEVLKDAASTAIYGSRGANGVIVVTTKRAKPNQATEISFNSFAGINEPKIPKMMSGEQYVQFRRDVGRVQKGWENGYPADNLIFFPKELETITAGNYVNWQDLIFRNGLNQQYNLNISHGSEKMQVFLSMGYLKQEGYYKTNQNERINMTLNVDYSLTKSLKVGLSSKLSNSGTDGYNSLGALSLAYMNPLAQPYDNNGKLNLFPAEANSNQFNILANYINPYKNNTNTLRGNNILYADLTILKGLKFRSNLSIDINRTQIDIFRGKYSFDQGGRTNYGQQSTSNTDDFVWDNILSYIKDFGNHNINFTGVSSFQSSTLEQSGAHGEGFPMDDISSWNLNAATANVGISSFYRKSSITSYLGRLQYSYKDKYILNSSFRADGSSVLSSGNQWGYFPSVSGAWIISREGFFKSSFVNNLKFRASYGTVGNSAINPYSTIATTTQQAYNFGNTYYYGYSLGNIANKSLGWEYSTTADIGFEFSFLNDRITGTMEIYQTKTKDLLMLRTLPTLSGFTSVFQNLGKTSNTGIELGLTTINVKGEKFKWSTDFNFYTNKEKIEKLITNSNMVGNNWFIGQPVNVYYNYQKIGIWQTAEATEAAKYFLKPGDVKIKDQNGDGKIDEVNDKIILGQRAPKINLFMRNSINYGNFNFAFALESKLGYMVNSAMLGNDVYYDGQRQGAASIYGNYWTPVNPTNEYPGLGVSSPLNYALTGYRKASYINVQEISLGYTVNKLSFFKTVEIYGRLKNPFYIYRQDINIDPQAPGFDISAFRSSVIGINVNF